MPKRNKDHSVDILKDQLGLLHDAGIKKKKSKNKKKQTTGKPLIETLRKEEEKKANQIKQNNQLFLSTRGGKKQRGKSLTSRMGKALDIVTRDPKDAKGANFVPEDERVLGPGYWKRYGLDKKKGNKNSNK
eukprot:TRINITY_DN8743_c0_g1_i1.p1 TRINITY_DN8743_c0_g1~~TRINITY_DN8743_c0_g1_i1.p1  ORF type:complete len:131 (-),score=29.04 TRINITY_DN8743_c0_g1_i1:96-488(-)